MTRPAVIALLLAALTLWFAPGTARAEGVEVQKAALVATEDGHTLVADFEIVLNATLEDTLNKGIALNFVLELELIRPRWYFFSEKVVNYAQQYKLSFSALTRQYRVSLGTIYQNFDTLNEALRFMGRVRGLQVARRGQLEQGASYNAALRLRLDVSQLPRPFQLTTVGSREWNIGADWHRFTVTP